MPTEDIYVCDNPTEAPSENQWTCDPMWLDQFEKMFDSSPPKGNENGVDDQGVCDQGGCDQGVYDQGVYDQGGCDQGVYDQGGCDQGVYDQGMYDQGVYDNGQYYEGCDQMTYATNAEQQIYEENPEVEGYEDYLDYEQVQTSHNTSNFCNNETKSDMKYISTTPYSQYPETEITLSTTTPCSSLYDSQYQTADQLHSDSTLYNTDQCIHTYNVINTVENVPIYWTSSLDSNTRRCSNPTSPPHENCGRNYRIRGIVPAATNPRKRSLCKRNSAAILSVQAIHHLF